MADYFRPSTQWADDTGGSPTDLVPWSLAYDPVTRVVTLNEFRRRVRAGLIYAASVTAGDVTTRTWTLVEDVNGETELQIAYSGDRVVITAPLPLADIGGPVGAGNTFNLYPDSGGNDFNLQMVT
jgi:hypothetical protein